MASRRRFSAASWSWKWRKGTSGLIRISPDPCRAAPRRRARREPPLSRTWRAGGGSARRAGRGSGEKGRQGSSESPLILAEQRLDGELDESLRFLGHGEQAAVQRGELVVEVAKRDVRAHPNLP